MITENLTAYFIAHAPSEPWGFFEPDMPPFPEEPTELPKHYQVHIADLTIEERQELNRYVQVMSEWQERAAQWHKDWSRQRLIQWPKYWAKLMIEEMQRG